MKTQQRKLMLHWSLLTSGLIIIFWMIRYFVTGSVPINVQPETIAIFTAPRWLDILLGVIYPIILVRIFTSSKINKKDEDLIAGLLAGLLAGLIANLVFGLVFSLIDGLFLVVIFSIIFGLGFGLIFGLGFGLIFGLGFGLIFGLGFGLVTGLIFSLGLGLKLLFNWAKTWDWLIG